MRLVLLLVMLSGGLIPHAAQAAVFGECLQLGEWGSRGIPNDFSIDGNRLFAADGRGVTAYDISNPSALRQLSVYRSSSPSLRIAQTESQVVLLTEESLVLFNRSGDVLTHAHEIPNSGHRNVSIRGDDVIAAGTQLELFKIADGRLQQRRLRSLSSAARAISVVESYIYLALGNDSIVVNRFDESLDEVTQLAASGHAFALAGTNLYAAASGNGIYILDVADPANPIVQNRVLLGDVDLRDITVDGSRLHTLDNLAPRGVITFDISNPETPQLLGRQIEPTSILESGNGRLYTSGFLRFANGSSTASGSPVRIFEPGTDGTLRLLGQFLDYAGPLAGVATDGAFAYVADPPLFRVIDIRRPDDPRQIAAIPLDDSADRASLQGKRVLVYGRGNVHIIDVEDPFAPRYRGVFRSLGTIPNGAAFAGDYVLEANRASGFHVLDVTIPAIPFQTSGLKNDSYGQFYGVVARPGTAYGFKPRGIQVIDLSNPAAARVHQVIFTRAIIDAAIAPATAERPELLLVVDMTTLRIFDITAPLEPVELTPIEVPNIVDLSVAASNAYLTTTSGDLLRLDFSDPRRPAIVDTYSGLKRGTQVAVASGKILVADAYSLQILVDPALASQTPAFAPVLSTETVTATRMASLHWTTGDADLFEVEIDDGTDFADPERRQLSADRITTTVDGPLFVRVRATNGCNAGAWSNTVAITPTEVPSPAFVGSGRHIIARDFEELISITVPVINSSPNTLPLRVAGAAAIEAPSTIGPGERAQARVDFLPQTISASKVVTLSIEGSSSTYEIRITKVSPASAPRDRDSDFLIVPGVSSSPGANGSLWRSTLNLFCRSGSSCSAEVAFVRYGTLGNSPTVSLTLAAGELLVVDDVVFRLFGESGTGAIEIRSPRLSALEASASTYNDGPRGRFGQRITAKLVDRREVATTSPRRLLGVVHDSNFRTNIGLVDGSSNPQTVLLRAVRPDGSLAAESQRSLLPTEGIQLAFNDIFPMTTFAGGSVEVEAAEGVVIYQSRVDQRTGDGTFSHAMHRGIPIEPQDLPLYVRAMDVAATTPGAGNTLWRTAIHLVNEGDRNAELRLTFIPANDVAGAVTTGLVLAPGNGVLTEDALADLFPEIPPANAYGSVRVTSNLPFTGWGRLYNDSADGTYGQYVPLREVGPARRPSQVPPRTEILDKGILQNDLNARQIYPVSEDSARRTNLGFAELSGKGATVTLKIYDSLSQLLAVTERSFEPLASGPLFGLLTDLGLEGVESLRIEVEQQGEGSVSAYASIVEQSTGDGQFIAAE